MTDKINKISVCEVTDVFDFFKYWSDMRPAAVITSKNRKLSKNDRLIIHWLITLTDRISERDIGPK